MTSALFDDVIEVEQPDPTEPPRRRQRADIKAQLERLGALQCEGYVAVRGKTGATVFNFGGWRP